MASRRSRKIKQPSELPLREAGARVSSSGGAPDSAAVPTDGARRVILLALAVLAAALLAYAPALNGSLLWDDAGHVTAPELRSLGGLWRIWFELGATQQYYPVLHSAFWLEHRLWGDHVLGYHLINVVFHATSACLVAAIMQQLRLPGGWLAAIVFALHPVHVESVAWITEQKNTLSVVLALTACFLFLRFRASRRWTVYAAATAVFLTAVLSKTAVAPLPAALLVIIWWQQGRLDLRRDVAPLLPWLAIAVICGAFTTYVEWRYIGAEGEAFELTVLQRVLLAARVVVFYASKLVWPANLIFSYPRWTIEPSAPTAWLFVAILVGTAAIAWRLIARGRGPAASLAAFVLMLGPVLGFVNVFPFLFSYVADHFQYLASLALIVPLSAMAARRAGQRLSARAALAAMLVVAGVLGVLTWRQSRMYRDVETLFRETIRRNPESWMAHTNLGVELAKNAATLPEAIAHFEATVRLHPNHLATRRNLALAYWQTGRPAEAIRQYEAALSLDPNNAADHLSLARLLSDVPARRVDARQHAEAAVRLDPQSGDAQLTLANILTDLHDPGALAAYERAIVLRPESAEARLNYGALLVTSEGRQAEALPQFEAAARLDPTSVTAHYNLATLLMEVPGREPDAIRHFEEALRLEPTLVAAHHNLGVLLSNIPGRRNDAARHLEAALRLDPTLEPTRALLNRIGPSTPSGSASAGPGF